MSRRFRDLDEFWPFYVSQHLSRGNRILHFWGTTCGLLWLAAGLATGRCWTLAAGLGNAYALAWIGHFFIEKNRPATFAYPLFSFRADFRMYALMWRGGMEGEIARLKDEVRAYRLHGRS